MKTIEVEKYLRSVDWNSTHCVEDVQDALRQFGEEVKEECVKECKKQNKHCPTKSRGTPHHLADVSAIRQNVIIK